VFPRIPLSNNRTIRMHWAQRRKDGQAWQMVVDAVCGRPHFPTVSAVTLEITVFRNRLQDPDNAIASLKPLIDALNRADWLADDDCHGLTLVAHQAKVPKKEERTEIEWKITKVGK